MALIMAIAAGMSAEEKRWVKMNELAPQLCALSFQVNLTPEECEIQMVDAKGALDMGKVAAKTLKNANYLRQSRERVTRMLGDFRTALARK